MAGHSKPIIRTDTTVLTEDLQRLNDLLSRDLDDILSGLSDKQNTVCAGLDVEFDYQTNEATVFNGCGVVATSNSLELSQYVDVSKVHFLNLRRLQGDELKVTINPTDYPITPTNQYILLCLKNNNVWSESSANAATEAEVASPESSDVKRTIMVWDPASLGLNPVFNKPVCVHNEPTYDLKLVSVDLSKVIYEDLNAPPLSNIAKAIVECKDNYSFIDTSVEKDAILELAVFQLVNGAIVRYEPCQRRLGRVCLTDISTQGGVFSKNGFFTSGQCVFGDMQSKSASFDDLKVRTITNSRLWDPIAGSFGGSTFYLGMPVYGADGLLQFPDNTISPLTVVKEFSLINSSDPLAVKSLYYNGDTNQIDINANVVITSDALVKRLEVIESIYSTGGRFSVVERNGKAAVIVDGDIEVTGGIYQGSASASASFDSVVSKKFTVQDGAEYATISRLGFVAPSLAAEFLAIQAVSGTSVIGEAKFFKTGTTNQLNPKTIVNDIGRSDGLLKCPHIGAYGITAHSIQTSIDGYEGNITTAELYVKKKIEAAEAKLFINSIDVKNLSTGQTVTILNDVGDIYAKSIEVDKGRCGSIYFYNSNDQSLSTYQPQASTDPITVAMRSFGANDCKIYDIEVHGSVTFLDTNKIEQTKISSKTIDTGQVEASEVYYKHPTRRHIKYFPAQTLRPVDSKIGFEHSETEAAGLNEVIRHKGIDRSSRLISPMRNDSGQPNGGDFDRRELSVALQSSLSVDIVSSSLLWIPDHDVYPFGYPYGKYGFIVDMSEFIGQYVSAVWVVTDYSHHPIFSLARSAQATYDRYPNNFSCTILQGRNQIADWSSAGDYSASYRKSLGFTPEPTAASNPKSVIVSDVDPYLHIRIDTPALRLDVGDDRLDGFGDSYLSGGFGPNGGSAILGVFVQFEPKKVDILYPLIISKFCKDV